MVGVLLLLVSEGYEEVVEGGLLRDDGALAAGDLERAREVWKLSECGVLMMRGMIARQLPGSLAR